MCGILLRTVTHTSHRASALSRCYHGYHAQAPCPPYSYRYRPRSAHALTEPKHAASKHCTVYVVHSFVGTKSWLLAGSKMRVKSVGGRAAAQPREGPRHGDHCCLVKNMKKQNYAPGLRRTGTTGPPEWAKASGARLWSGHQNCALKAFVAVRALVHWACVRAGAHMPCRLPTQRTGGATRGPARAPAPFDASALSWS